MKRVRLRLASRRRGPTVRMSERSWGAMVLVWLAALSVAPAARAQSRGVVESVSASEGDDGVTSVWIAVSSRPTFTTWKLEQPARVVIDISGTRLGPVTVPFDAGTFAVGAVSAIASEGDGGPRTRVVLTLRRAADYDVESNGNRIAVRVRPHERQTPAPARADVTRLQNEAVKARQQADSQRGEAEQLAQRLTEERRALEAERQKMKQAEQAAAETSRQLATERAEADRARAEVDRLRAEAQAALASATAAQKSAEERLRKGRAEQGQKLDSEMAQARAETERARLAAQNAAAEVARLAKERTALAGLRAELDRRERSPGQCRGRRAPHPATDRRPPPAHGRGAQEGGGRAARRPGPRPRGWPSSASSSTPSWPLRRSSGSAWPRPSSW